MIIFIFITFSLTTSFSLFSFSLKINKVNRAVINTPMEIFITAIPLTEMSENEAYFAKEEINKNLISYYDREVKPCMEDYTFETFYYMKSDHSLCINDKCNAVEVIINGTINSIYNYHRSMYYEIRGVVNE